MEYDLMRDAWNLCKRWHTGEAALRSASEAERAQISMRLRDAFNALETIWGNASEEIVALTGLEPENPTRVVFPGEFYERIGLMSITIGDAEAAYAAFGRALFFERRDGTPKGHLTALINVANIRIDYLNGDGVVELLDEAMEIIRQNTALKCVEERIIDLQNVLIARRTKDNAP